MNSVKAKEVLKVVNFGMIKSTKSDGSNLNSSIGVASYIDNLSLELNECDDDDENALIENISDSISTNEPKNLYKSLDRTKKVVTYKSKETNQLSQKLKNTAKIICDEDYAETHLSIVTRTRSHSKPKKFSKVLTTTLDVLVDTDDDSESNQLYKEEYTTPKNPKKIDKENIFKSPLPQLTINDNGNSRKINGSKLPETILHVDNWWHKDEFKNRLKGKYARKRTFINNQHLLHQT
jgi:hypothetical protein